MNEPKKHLSRSLERHVKAPRQHTWDVLHDLLEQVAGGYVIEGNPPPHGAGAVLHIRLPGLAESLGYSEPLGRSEPLPPETLVETVLSYEPPWRRAYSLSGEITGLELYHGTFVLRDDGPECHLAWGVVTEPEPTPQGLAFLDFIVGAIDGFLGLVATTAERSEV